MKTVIGLFDTSADAYAAQSELLSANIERGRISAVTSQTNRDYGSSSQPNRTEASEGAGIGATAGALTGGAVGILASLGLLAIPGIGWLLGAGALVTTLAGAGAGAVAGGLIGGLVGMGIPEHEAEIYEEGVKRGGVLLTVDASDSDADRVAAILSRHNAVDIERRASEWETAGWQRRAPARSSPSSSMPSSAASTGMDPRSRGTSRNSADMDAGSQSTAPSSTRRATGARIYNP